MIIARTGIIASSMSSYDIDVQAFISSAIITDITQKNALNQFVLDVKAANIWNKFRAIYPFVGGTASQHRYNLKAPTTNDSDFYITFGGGVTHGSNGVQFNGSTGYADTKVNANATNFAYDSMHACIYSRTNSDGAYYDMGVQTNSNFRFLEFDIREGNTFYGTEIHLGTNYLTYTNTDSRGCYILNRPNNSTINLFKDSTKVKTTAQNSTNAIFSNIPIWIGALNRTYASPTGYSNREYAFATLGDGLSDAEALALSNAIITFQTTLSRNI